MEIEEFERASKDKDFAIGDSFWINDIEFEVMSKRKPTISLNEKKESKFRESLRKVIDYLSDQESTDFWEHCECLTELHERDDWEQCKCEANKDHIYREVMTLLKEERKWKEENDRH